MAWLPNNGTPRSNPSGTGLLPTWENGKTAARIINVDTNGLTRASIYGMRPYDFEQQGTLEVYMDRVISRAVEARVAGAKESSFESLFMSRIKGIKNEIGRVSVSNESIILPYIYRRQRRNINSNYFKVSTNGNVTASQANSAGAATDYIALSTGVYSPAAHSGRRILTIENTGSKYGSSLIAIQKYFQPGKYITHEFVNTVTKVAGTAVFKVLAWDTSKTDSTAVKIVVEPNITDALWDANTNGIQSTFTGTNGNVFVLANSVSDYEKWANNETAENNQQLLCYFLQTSRETFQYNDEYIKALNSALVSGFWRDFQNMPLAEQRAKQHMKNTRQWIQSLFYGQRISEFQEPGSYEKLPQVKDLVQTDDLLEYKANALGFRTQLIDATRYVDHQGNPLNMDTLFAQLYDLKRNREADGGEVDSIDVMCDRWTAGAILDKMVAFYKAKYGVSLERHYTPNESLVFENQVMFNYNKFQIPAELGGFTLNVFWHNFFNDKVTAYQGNPDSPDLDMGNRGRALWALDFSDIEIGIAKTASAQRKTNEADEMYYTVIQPNCTHYQLNSTTWTSIIEDPSRHYLFENFSDAAPTMSGV